MSEKSAASMDDDFVDYGVPLIGSAENPRPSPYPYKLLTVDEVAQLPPLQWSIKNILPETGIGSIFGPSQSGKSFLAFDLIGAAAAYRDWFGYRAKRCCKVAYIGLEGEAGIPGRVAAYRTRHSDACENMRFLLAPWNLCYADDRGQIVSAIKGIGWDGGILVIDTLNRASSGKDENKSDEMSEILSGLNDLQAALGGFVLAIHHTGKDGARGPRGHSSFSSNLDVLIEVEHEGENRCWSMFKSKDGPKGGKHYFDLEVVKLGVDEDGDDITSCVVAPTAPEHQPRKSVSLPKSGIQLIAWNEIGEMLKTGQIGVRGAPIGFPSIRVADAVDAISQKVLDEEPKRRKSRIKTAIEALCSKGLIGTNGEWLWLERF